MMATATAPIGTFVKFHQFAKLEDSKETDGAPTVWGVATWEKPDSDNECCDYESAVPVYQAWSAKALKRTKGAGQAPSLGNIRLQHGMDIGGKATKLEFNDESKEIWLGSEPLNDEIKQNLRDGFYTGYSQGGSYAWRSCMVCDTAMPMRQGDNFCPNCNKSVSVRYGLRRIAEVSYVDSPATGEGFEHVKANGSIEILKFQKKTPEAPVRKEKRTPEQLKTAKEKYVPLLKAEFEKAATAKGVTFEKSLWDVSRFAEVLMGMASIWECSVWEREIEGDESTVPDDMKDLLDTMVETFLAMATEEARELAARTTNKGDKSMTAEELQKEQQELDKAAKKSLATHFAKAESHHNKMALVHGKAMENCQDCMGKATKAAADREAARKTALAKENEVAKAAAEAKGETFVAKEDVGSGHDSSDVHEVLSNMVTFHKSAKACDEKMATHYGKMADAADADSAKAERAELAKSDATEAKIEADEELVRKNAQPKVPEVPTMEDDIKKAAAARRESPEYKDAVARIAKAQVEGEVAELEKKTLAPLGITLDPTTGAAILKGGIKLVPRDEEKPGDFAFAKTGTDSKTAGL
jgi:hypothetical protein